MGPEDGVALIPFKHIMVLGFQDAGGRKVWEAGVDAEWRTADVTDVTVPAVFQDVVFLFFLQFPVSFLIEEAGEVNQDCSLTLPYSSV